MNYVSHLGIDTGKDHLVCALLESGRDDPSWRQSFTNNEAGFASLLNSVSTDTCLVIEPTGNYSLQFVKYANARNRQVLMAPPRKAKDFLRSLQSRAKTDKLDSRGLALFARSRQLKPYPVKSAIVDQIDQLLKARRGLSDALSALEMRCKQLPHAQSHLDGAIKSLKEQIKAVDKEIRTVCRQDKDFSYLKKLTKVHGIGPVVGTAVLICLIDKKFSTPAQFVAYVGLDVGVAQSGQRKGQLGLTKEGNAELRRLLYIAAQSAVNCKESPFQPMYERLTGAGRKHKEAINIIARKIAKLCWSMVKYRSDYDPDRIFTRPTKDLDPMNVSEHCNVETAGGLHEAEDLTRA